MTTEKKIGDILKEINVPMGNLGFTYITSAVSLVLDDESMLRNITGDGGLYDLVGEFHNTSGKCVERSIRHGIERAFILSKREVWYKYFSNVFNKPTNREFIASIAYAVKHREE